MSCSITPSISCFPTAHKQGMTAVNDLSCFGGWPQHLLIKGPKPLPPKNPISPKHPTFCFSQLHGILLAFSSLVVMRILPPQLTKLTICPGFSLKVLGEWVGVGGGINVVLGTKVDFSVESKVQRMYLVRHPVLDSDQLCRCFWKSTQATGWWQAPCFPAASSRGVLQGHVALSHQGKL